MVLVAGATGSLGSRIAKGLRARGDEVRALVRPGSNGEALERAGVSLAFGDLRDPATLDAACAGVDIVISTASATGRSDDTPENVDGKGNANLIVAARRAGVSHFVLVSALGSSAESPVPAFRAKAFAEQALRTSGLTWTILQPAAFMDVWFAMFIEGPLAAGLPVTLVGESRRRHSFIAEKDVAAFAIAAATDPAAKNTTLVLGGPAAVTFRDVVAAYESALERAIPVVRVAPGEPIPGLPEPVWGIAAALETFDSPIPMEHMAQTFGVALTTLEMFASRSHFEPGAH